jgi:hypothetical protein
MKQILVACLVVASLGVCAPRAQACFCLLPELSDSFKSARSVFLGQTIRIDEQKTLDQNASIADRAFTVKFKIIRSWKGVPSATSELNILWLTNCYECLPLPNMNENYLVFADPVRGSKTWSLVAMCNRTVVVDAKVTDPDINPEHDMKQLDMLTKRAFTFAPSRSRRRA